MGNQQRDQRVIAQLLRDGWRVLVIWECATRSIYVENIVQTVACWLRSNDAHAELHANGLSTKIGRRKEQRT